jgi:hypothetical protein
VARMVALKVYSLGGLDKKSNDLTRSPDKASDMLNMEYDTQSTIKKRNGFEVFSSIPSDDMVYYSSKDEFLLFSNGSANITVLSGNGLTSKTLALPSGISSIANADISHCENQNNIYFTNADYSTYVMKYDGSNLYRAGLPTPRRGQSPVVNGLQPDLYPSLTATSGGYSRIFYSYKDINGNVTYSPYVQLGSALAGYYPTGSSVLTINSLKSDPNCIENGFFDKYCYRLKYTTWIMDSTNLTMPVTKHNYVAGDKFLMDTENLLIGISPSKSFLVLDVDSVQNNALTASFTASISGTTMTVTSVASGALAIGSKINATGIAADTYIVNFIGGSGGAGTYLVNNSQTLSSRAMTQTTSSITFTSASMNGYTISLYADSVYISVDYPVDVRTKVHIAASSNAESNYTILYVYAIDNSTTSNSIAFTKVENALWNGLPLTQLFEDLYDSATLKLMPPICKYVGSYGNQIVYGSIQSFFTAYSSSILNNPNQRIEYANNDLIIYSDISTGDGPENVSELNLVKVGETWDGYITGVKRCNDSMVIFKNRGVFTIDGALIDGEFQLRKITTNFAGCTSHKSILEADEGLYFQAHNGLYFTNAIGAKKISYEIDSVFNSAEYTTTRAVRLKKKQKSLFYVPQLSKVIVIDYYYNQIYFWDSVVASKGFVENAIGDVFFSNGSKIYKFNNGYSDNGSAINAYYSTTWHHAGEPSLNKKWLSIRTFALTNDVFDLTLTTQGDWNTTQLTSNTISFGATDQTKFTMLNMQTKRSLRFTFANAINNQNLVITGYEVNFEVFNNVDKN